MSDQAPNGAAPAAPPEQPAPDVFTVMAGLLEVVELCATKAKGDTDARDAKDWLAAALAGAQAYITLDPARLIGGDTPGARRAALPPVSDGNKDGKIG